MEYKDFLQELKAKLCLLCEEDSEINIQKVQKNNSTIMDAVVIHKKGDNISPTIYVKTFYESFIMGESLDEIAREIIDIDESNRAPFEFDIDNFYDFKNVSDNIIIKIINTERNMAMLQKVPHRNILDFSVVYCCLVSRYDDSLASTIVQNSFLDKWEVSEEELFEIAFRNTNRINTPVLKSMNEIMIEMLSGYDVLNSEKQRLLEELSQDEVVFPMYVLSNEHKLMGAATLIYTDILDSFAEDYGDFYIIPSSIHELILVPMSNEIEPSELLNMVSEVNDNELAPEEVLSDNIYVYNYSNHELQLVNNIRKNTLEILNC